MSVELETFKLPGGHEVKTGLLLPQPGETLTMLGDAPESYFWEDADIKKAIESAPYLERRKIFGRWMVNQDTLGTCCASANVGGFYQLRHDAGYTHIALADNHLYWRGNGGGDNGMALVTALNEIQRGGICPRIIKVNGRDYRIPEAYSKRQLPAGVAEAADKAGIGFLSFEGFKVPKDYQGFRRCIATAMAKRHPVVWAWHVDGNGMRLRNGFMVVGRGVGNHANVLQAGKWIGGADLIHLDNKNSWGPVQDEMYGPRGASWGEGGFGLVTMQDAFKCIQYHDFYVITSVRMNPQETIY